jgi:hypothetical protein
MRRSPTRALVALTALALLAAGCGGSSATAPAPATAPVLTELTSVAAASAQTESASFELTLATSFGEQDLTIGASGAFDSADDRARLTFDMSALAELLGGFGAAFGAKPGDLEGFDDPEKWQLEALQDGRILYLRFPLIASELPAGKEWIKVDVDALAQMKGVEVDLEQLGSFGATDPLSILDALKAVSGPLETVGREEIRGTETTHYRTTLDPAKIVAQAEAAGATEDVLGSFKDALAQANLASVPLDVWVDDSGLLRRMEIDASMSQEGLEGEMSMRLTFDLFDYGAEVDVEPPPADLVVDAATLAPTGS